MSTVITGAQVFDGERSLGSLDVIVSGGVIASIGGDPPSGVDVVDGRGCTLVPGLIDAHVHTSPEALRLALRFGVTTELEMQGMHTREHRRDIEDDDTSADVRSSGLAITPPGGHPSELFPDDFDPSGGRARSDDEHAGSGRPAERPFQPFTSTPAEAVAHVGILVESGSDYIKFIVDDGSVEGTPVPMLDQATLDAGVAEAQRLGMLTVAHALTRDATRMCLEAGVDGLVHLFMDGPHDDDLLARIAGSGTFVVPCVVLNASMMGLNGAALADDHRVASRLDAAWDRTLRSSFDRYPQGSIDHVLDSVRALHEAGVRLLAGTDSSAPFPFLGGLAHGASVHHEMQYLVRAGLSPSAALRAATSEAAEAFGLSDRGRIAPGLRADLLLVEGDPTTDIAATLDIRAVWRHGTRLDSDGPPAR
ncbi:imidazolonepropionase [Nocardioides sp. Soil774]|uniref:amidohydrolase family protein n=1 Tax=Nocardioides sp. Soil774 TaxID=1736408 RepID=UPI0007010529|nr:amidohydrolase family protein [Nocardioides sp. Soil774]KRE94186.1 imidazolonepropionase [Nocardioides sp. Soil774]